MIAYKCDDSNRFWSTYFINLLYLAQQSKRDKIIKTNCFKQL